MKWLLIFVLFASGLAFGQCATTDYLNNAKCIQVGHDSHTDNSNTTTVSLSPVTGHQTLLFSYWCESSDCLTTPTHTITIGSNTSTACYSASPSSPLYLTETGAQKIGNYMAACNSIPASTVTLTNTCSVSGACWYLTEMESEWTGLAASQPMVDRDGGCGSTSAGTSGSCNTTGSTSFTNELVLGYWTTISDFTVTFTTPASSKQVIDFGGTVGGLTVAASGTHTLAGNWSTSDSWTVMLMSVKTAVSAAGSTNQYPHMIR